MGKIAVKILTGMPRQVELEVDEMGISTEELLDRLKPQLGPFSSLGHCILFVNGQNIEYSKSKIIKEGDVIIAVRWLTGG